MYYYNNEPLQLSYRNDYTTGEKIEIVLQLQNDLKVGCSLRSKCGGLWTIKGLELGQFKKKLIKLMFDGKIKLNPITLDDLTNF